MFTAWPPTCMPNSELLVASFTIASSYTMNNKGDSEHPCLTPVPTEHAPAATRHNCAADWGRENDGEWLEARYGRITASTATVLHLRELIINHTDEKLVAGHVLLHDVVMWVQLVTEHYGYAVGAKLGTYSGNSCLETFLAKFNNCARCQIF